MEVMRPSLTSAIAANRFGLGARPGDLAAIGDSGPDWLHSQLTGGAPALAGLQSTAQILQQVYSVRRQIHAARLAAQSHPASGAADPAQLRHLARSLPRLLRPIYRAEAGARFHAAVVSERPFIERLVWFWSNHFAVSIDKGILAGIAGSFEREAIRPHVLGNFNDMLLATERHPAMLIYLDNQMSMGPHSRAARNIERRHPGRRVGINENLGRETLELHTVSVEGGYTQADVTSFSEGLTGWSIAGPQAWRFGGEPGTFQFRAAMHEPGAKVVMGRRYPEAGYEQGVSVLRDLARHPSTAHFLATKLARHFIADDPPAAAVQRMARAFSDSGGDLPSVYRALIDSPEAWTQPLAKYKSPSDYIVSTFRGLGLTVNARKAPVGLFYLLGQPIWRPGSPAGWPDKTADWNGASELLKRIEWADALGQRVGPRRDARELAPQLLAGILGDETRESIARAESGAQAVTLLLASPEFMRR